MEPFHYLNVSRTLFPYNVVVSLNWPFEATERYVETPTIIQNLAQARKLFREVMPSRLDDAENNLGLVR